MQTLIAGTLYEVIIHRRQDWHKRIERVSYQLINPARQVKKASGLSGRQWRKRKKAARRA